MFVNLDDFLVVANVLSAVVGDEILNQSHLNQISVRNEMSNKGLKHDLSLKHFAHFFFTDWQQTDMEVCSRVSMEVSNYLVSWFTTHLWDLQPAFIGDIIHLRSTIDIPVLILSLGKMTVGRRSTCVTEYMYKLGVSKISKGKVEYPSESTRDIYQHIPPIYGLYNGCVEVYLWIVGKPSGSNHLLRMIMEPKYLAEKVIVHPNHPLTR